MGQPFSFRSTPGEYEKTGRVPGWNAEAVRISRKKSAIVQGLSSPSSFTCPRFYLSIFLGLGSSRGFFDLFKIFFFIVLDPDNGPVRAMSDLLIEFNYRGFITIFPSLAEC